MKNREAKDALFAELARAAKALANGRRAEIIDVLANGERSVESLAEAVDQSIANTSQHLQKLRAAGLVTARPRGTYVYYSLAGPEVAAFWRALQDFATARLDRVDELARAYLGRAPTLEPLSKDELLERIDEDPEIVVLDVRPTEEFDAGHIPGAVSIPVQELKRRLKEIPERVEVVAYCRGPYCAFAHEAVRLLERRGYNATRMQDGFPDWAAAGYPVEDVRAHSDGN
ncbi:MAG TPA: metalloregulator ArsR/SmtB family transcription factor [Actinomycetota bacterium]|jgi:rhodanese-related sulfurtransferase|nr:metalloregulator ArsR/SmtB family transcription factor [Actinomycetota bacterium]